MTELRRDVESLLREDRYATVEVIAATLRRRVTAALRRVRRDVLEELYWRHERRTAWGRS